MPEQYTTVPTKVWKKIERFIDMQTSNPGELIDEDEACKLLKIKKSSIQVMVSNGKIPKTHYTVGVGGSRFYYKDKLMGV